LKVEPLLERTTCPHVVSQRLGCPWGVFVKVAVMALAGLILPLAHTWADVVYVCGYGGPLQKLSTNGVASLVTTNFSGGDGPIGLVCDNVGNVYAGDPGTSTIWRFSPDGSTFDVGFADSVSGLAFDTTGILYVTIPDYDALILPDYLSGKYYVSGFSAGTWINLIYPITLALDNSNSAYVANNTNAAPPIPFPFSPSPYDNTIEKFAYGPNWTNLGTFASGLNSCNAPLSAGVTGICSWRIVSGGLLRGSRGIRG
jgi:hypothetical protein